MADLVGDHIGLREPARRAVRAGAELALHIVEERGVEIDALIARAVERPHRRFGKGARRRLGAGEQPQFRRVIGPPAGGEDFRPAILGVAEHQRDELAGRVGRRSRRDRRGVAGLLRGRAAAGENLRAVEQHAGIDAEVPADQSDNDDRADAEAAGAARHAAARRALLAIVLDIAAGAEIIGAHCSFSFAPSSRASFAVTYSGTIAAAAHMRLTKYFPAFIA